jgi:hypothetical protein
VAKTTAVKIAAVKIGVVRIPLAERLSILFVYL